MATATATRGTETGNGVAPAEGGSELVNMFTPVSGEKVKSRRYSRPSKSQALFDAFMATNMYAAELSADALNRASGDKRLDANSLVSRLNSFARDRVVPIRAVTGPSDTIYFVRLDRNEAGDAVADWEAELTKTRRSRKGTDNSIE